MGCGGSSQAAGSPVPVAESPQPKIKLVTGGNQDLLRTTLETCSAAFCEIEVAPMSAGLLIDEISKRANTIMDERIGKGLHGTCPFSSAYEVHLFYQFCLSYLGVWSGHDLGKDKEVDAAFYSQLNTLCEILSRLDTSAVFLPTEIADNIQLLKQEALWPNWFTGEKMKGVAPAMQCLAIGKEWKLEETKAYQDALATIECSTQSGSESESNAHN
jgi:hypothetical protein